MVAFGEGTENAKYIALLNRSPEQPSKSTQKLNAFISPHTLPYRYSALDLSYVPITTECVIHAHSYYSLKRNAKDNTGI